MTRSIRPARFRTSAIAGAAALVLSPLPALAVDLVQEPPVPLVKNSYVAPNVIISIDDSGSMDFQVGSANAGVKTLVKPNDDGTWDSRAPRINVLKYSLKEVFSDKTLLPDNKIRLAWQAMWNNGKSSGVGVGSGYVNGGANSVDSASFGINSMAPLDASSASNSTHRTDFITFINRLTAQNGTPSHLMFKQADDYMRRTLSASGPWSSNPGGTDSKSTEYLGCRRNYHIMMTDGRWNGAVSGGDQDGHNWTLLGDRQTFAVTSDQVRLYKDTVQNTLADWAFKSWMDPLQGASLKDANTLKPSKDYIDAPATESFTSGNRSVTLQKYWNPRYNPATWPHMVTYTIGFSSDASTWPAAPGIIAPTQKTPFGYDKGFAAIATGAQEWPDMQTQGENVRALDLWHAAINGRGRFYAVTQSQDLALAFKEIIGKINEDSATLPSQITSGGATSGFNVSQNNAGIFASVYSAKDAWSGYVTASQAIEPEEYACPTADDPDKKCYRFANPVAGWEGKHTGQRLDAMSPEARVIYTWADNTAKGVPFKWTSSAEMAVSNAQKATLLGLASGATLSADDKAKGINLAGFLRGDRSLEGGTTAKPYRVRTSRQGDIVNSDIWYTGAPVGTYGLQGYSAFVSANKARTPVLYVGGNDGMLHGFSAVNGNEVLAYVPRGVFDGLRDLADPNYKHRYYVDGSPMTGDIKDDATWKTMLVAPLGAGAKGYVVLDVTNPAGFTEPAAATVAVADKSRAGTDATASCASLSGAAKAACEEPNDIGFITSRPVRNPSNPQEALQITRLNNGRWAAVLGNGYNSANQRPVLLLQYLDGDHSLRRIQATSDAPGTGKANDNGLATPTLVDLDANGTTDVVYAGDNLGNMWKFDLTAAEDASWAVAFGGEPLFTARGRASKTVTRRDTVQPISAPPTVRANDRLMTVGTGTAARTVPVGGMMVAFGTGRNVTESDRNTAATPAVQTLYSVLDNTRYCLRADKKALKVISGASDTGCAVAPPSGSAAPAPIGVLGASGSPLAEQKVKAVSGGVAGAATLETSQPLSAATWKDYQGWYLDLPADGERILKPLQFYDGSNVLAVYSETPAGTASTGSSNAATEESCVPLTVNTSAGHQYRTLINIMDGKTPSLQLVDFNSDNLFTALDQNVNRREVAVGTPLLIADPNRIHEKTGGGDELLARMPEQSTRPSWRQLR